MADSYYRCAGCGRAAFTFDGLGLCRDCSAERLSAEEERDGSRSPHPTLAEGYHRGPGEPRFLACEVDVASMVPLDDKVKAPSLRVLHEVDRFGDPIGEAADGAVS